MEWYQRYNGNVYVSFSGGKDSTVLLHIARKIFPDIPAVFSNTGLEYYQIQRFAKQHDNVTFIAPKIRFDQVVSQFGYPLISKEVAEAIYYARRINSQSVQVERERESGGGPNCLAQGARTCGKQTDWKRLEIGGAACPLIKTGTARARRTVLQGRWTDERQAGVKQTGQTGEGVVFSNSEEQFGEKSQFNKEKYLPLVYTPFLISHMCCHKMKKAPLKAYQRQTKSFPILATMAEESRIRKQAWIRHGCNAFESNHPMSQPLSFWTEQDVLAYIVKYNVPLCPVYGDIVAVDDEGNTYDRELARIMIKCNLPCNLSCTGCKRTGCVFCGFGFHNEKGKTRFQLLAEIEPRKYEYALQGGAMG